MKTTISSRGQIVLPAEFRQVDRIEAGQEFDVERLDAGDYRLVRRPVASSAGAVDWLLACPAKGYFVPADGGVPVVLAGLTEAGNDSSLGGSWGTDDTILFSSGTGISTVGASGGAMVSMTTAGAEWHASPRHLPGGSPFLFAKRVLSAPAPSGFDTPDANDLEIAVQDSPGARPRIVLEDARKTLGRLSVDPPGLYPHWSPDGTRLAFENRGSGAPFFLRSADGSGAVVAIDAPGRNPALQSWSSDGRSLLYQVSGDTTDRELWTVSVDGERTAAPLIATRFFEGGGTLSPDGKLVAWVSSETGVNQVYVQTYPAGAGRVQVSVDGGVEPVWSRSGKELFFRFGDKMLSVAVSTTPSLIVGVPTVLFEGRFESYGGARPNYDVHPDGQRFLMLRAVEAPSMTDAQLVYSSDWPQLLVDKKPVARPP